MPRATTTVAPAVTTRELNRATLARQALLERREMTPLAMVEHLVGMQAQAPTAPYFGLWSRLGHFSPDDLSCLLVDRSLVRIAVMRGTVHLLTARDALILRPLVQPIVDGHLRQKSFHTAGIANADLGELAAHARALLEAEPRPLNDLRPLLAERFPGNVPAELAWAVRLLLPLVQIPPRGIWGSGGLPVCTTLGAWLGSEEDPGGSLEDLVRRYLRAFGPASVRDAQAWSGLTRLGNVFSRLRPELISFVDDRGVELFDLPDAPRPDPATPAPPRILAPWDNVLISFADRRRMLKDEYKLRVFSQNGIVQSSLLVDGMVKGVVTLKRAKQAASVTIDLFEPISSEDRELAALEAERLMSFAEPDATARGVAFTGAAERRRERRLPHMSSPGAGH